jgi:DNA-binding transcriptional ArsR family regulator
VSDDPVASQPGQTWLGGTEPGAAELDELPPGPGVSGNPVVLRDPRAIKALAHPARLAVIEAFFAGRRLTATECGDIAGLSASAMSYHLRALERWGIIRRSAATGDGRERPWEAAGDRLAVESSEPRATAAGEAMLAATMLDRIRAEALAWVTNPDPAWYDLVSIGSGSYWLTLTEARELSEAIAGVIAGYKRRSAEQAPDGARRVRVAFAVVPVENLPVENPLVENLSVENLSVENLSVENLSVENLPVENLPVDNGLGPVGSELAEPVGIEPADQWPNSVDPSP